MRRDVTLTSTRAEVMQLTLIHQLIRLGDVKCLWIHLNRRSDAQVRFSRLFSPSVCSRKWHGSVQEEREWLAGSAQRGESKKQTITMSQVYSPVKWFSFIIFQRWLSPRTWTQTVKPQSLIWATAVPLNLLLFEEAGSDYCFLKSAGLWAFESHYQLNTHQTAACWL